MEFIEGFAWPVPRALSGAVSACRFEQGDVLYSDLAGYGAWPAGRRGLGFALQVLDPPKSTRALGPEAEGKRFDAHWTSPVELELTDYVEGSAQRWATTQGRLFSCLWRGDPAALDPEAAVADPPGSQRDLHGRLDEARPAFEAHFTAQGSGSGARLPLYLAALDDASETARLRAKAVEAVLAEQFEIHRHTLSPGDAGLTGADALHPALRIRGLAIAAPDGAAIEACLRGLLYGGASEAGRFSLARHGLLVDAASG
jgi:hypothetical protein